MKSHKIYILAAISLLVGLVVFTIGFALAGFDITKIGTETEYQEKNFVSTGTVKDIVIDESNLSVEIVQSMDEQVHVTYYENDKDYYDIGQSADGTLRIIKKNHRKWYDYFFNINFQSVKLIVAVPDDFSGDISGESSNAKIHLSGIHARDIHLDTSNGKIEAENIVISGKFEASTSNASITLSNVTASGDIFCDTSSGKISLDKLEGKNININTSNGSVILKSTLSNENILIETSNGSVNFDDIRFKTELDCHNSNGSVKGAITGKITDYTIKSETSNGKNNLPEKLNGGSKTIIIETSNGSIEIDFIG